MSGPPKTAFRVSQVLNAALSASVIICLAQGLPSVANSEAFPGNLFPSCILASVIVAYNLKQYLDEYRTFEYAKNERFSMPRTVFFSAISYLFLAAAGYSLSVLPVSASFLALYFVSLIAWSFFSLIARFSYEDNAPNIDKIRRRILWIVIYFFCAAILSVLVLYGKIESSRYLAAAFLLIFWFYIYDVRDSRTFDPKHTKGV